MEVPDPADGLILLDKPSGMTSHDCVAAVRRLCPRKTKVGHGGTLDPFCTGLLILLVGKSTRLASFFQGMDKAYEGVIRFGEGTDSFDRDGRSTQKGDVPSLDPEQWQTFSNDFVGRTMQVPPAFSAKRVGHVRAYELARRGETPDLESVPVTIYSLKVSPLGGSDLHFRLRCSSGTYVRALARDMGEKVKSPAHCYQLCRTAVGSFSVQDANSLDRPFAAPGFIPFDEVDLGFPVHQANHREEKLILNGGKIGGDKDLHGFEGMIKIVAPSGRFVALGRMEGMDIQPAVVFPE